MNGNPTASRRTFRLGHILLGIALTTTSGCVAANPGVVGLVASAAENPSPVVRSSGATPATTGTAKKVITGRPAIHALPNGCTPAGLKFQCNPVTNVGCDGAKGEACDDDEHDGFGCYPGPSTVEEGGACNDQTGPACRGGMGCDTGDDKEPAGVCHKYCCSDADCGSTLCQTIDNASGTLGFCS